MCHDRVNLETEVARLAELKAQVQFQNQQLQNELESFIQIEDNVRAALDQRKALDSSPMKVIGGSPMVAE